MVLILHSVAVAGRKVQASEKLYYFKSKGLVGVKDRAGRIIIPANNEDVPDHRAGEPVTTTLINLWPKGDTSERRSFGVTYSRKGEPLFRPFNYDNGPDYFSEGRCRFVKAGKIGFVNRRGEITIPAQFDFATPFEYGISAYCNGCVWKSDGEHERFVSGRWGYINYKGEQLQPMQRKASSKDQQIDSATCIAYPFSYTPFEQSILAFFQKQSAIAQAYFLYYTDKPDSSMRQLSYEIVERPSLSSPYYQLAAFWLYNGHYFSVHTGITFLVSRDGSHSYALKDETRMPFKSWLKAYLAEAKLFLKEHGRAPL